MQKDQAAAEVRAWAEAKARVEQVLGSITAAGYEMQKQPCRGWSLSVQQDGHDSDLQVCIFGPNLAEVW